MKTGHTHIKLVSAAVVVGAALALSLASSAPAVGDPSACAHVDAPMLDIPTVSETEPRMRIPQPPGWERTFELDSVDEAIRFTLTKSGPATERPNVVGVGLDPAPDADADAQTIFDTVHTNLVTTLAAKDIQTAVKTAATTICGLPAAKLTYRVAPKAPPVTALHVVTKAGSDTYLVSVITTTEPNNPTNRRDAETILAGFQVLPPTAVAP